MTFSIVAIDPTSRDIGIGVASKFLAVGAVVPHGKADIGGIATQAHANSTYGPLGLEMLANGYSPEAVVKGLTGSDDQHEHRQVGVVDARGAAATFTGSECLAWAGGRTGQNYAVQGNILAGPEVIDAMAQSFESAVGDALADRIVASLIAGQRHGGDRRGQQSAALLVVRNAGGYAGLNDRFIDLRVDDHSAPIHELSRLLSIHRLYFGDTRPEDILEVDDDLQHLAGEILERARSRGAQIPPRTEHMPVMRALEALYGIENLEERWLGPERVDRAAVSYLSKKFLGHETDLSGAG